MWTKKEIEKLENYTKSCSEDLISNMLMNIVVGFEYFKKPTWFFRSLSKSLRKSSKVCKRKFKQMEKVLYTNQLGVSENYFELFCKIRTKQQNEVDYNLESFLQSTHLRNSDSYQSNKSSQEGLRQFFWKVESNAKEEKSKENQKKCGKDVEGDMDAVRFDVILKIQTGELAMADNLKGRANSKKS